MNPEIDAVLEDRQRWCVVHDSCLHGLAQLPDCSVDSCVTDPPSGIGFLGYEWDSDKGGRDVWILWLTQVMLEVFRVLKPGAHAVVWALPRTSHWTATAIENAGFEIRDKIAHVFASGMPKSANASKAVDAHFFGLWLAENPEAESWWKTCDTLTRWVNQLPRIARDPEWKKRIAAARAMVIAGWGYTREVIHRYTASGNAGTETVDKGGTYAVGAENSDPIELTVTRGATPEGQEWDGWGTGVKPAHESWILARKPIDDFTRIGRCLSELFVSIAGLRSTSSAGEPKPQGSVPCSAEGSLATPDGSSAATDTSRSGSAINSSLSIVSSWRTTLEEVSELESTCTTEMELSLTTDLKTLSFLLSKITPENILVASTQKNGSPSNVFAAAHLFDALRARCAAIRTLSATANATCAAECSVESAGASPQSTSAQQTEPSHENWILCRKPMAGTLAENLLKHGTGAINIDACRIATDWDEPDRPDSWKRSGHSANPEAEKIAAPPGTGIECHPGGRFPANFILSHHPECKRVGDRKVRGSNFDGHPEGPKRHVLGKDHRPRPPGGYASPDGTETVPSYDCHQDCQVRLLDAQSGELRSGYMAAGTQRANRNGYSGNTPEQTARDTYGDSGAASRFFNTFEVEDWDLFTYAAKASRAEREAGLEALPARSGAAAVKRAEDSAGLSARAGANRSARQIRNVHGTVKNERAMRHFVRLVTPKNGICVDPFAGTGTTGIACWNSDARFIGYELNDTDEEPYVRIARARIAHAARRGKQQDLFDRFVGAIEKAGFKRADGEAV